LLDTVNGKKNSLTEHIVAREFKLFVNVNNLDYNTNKCWLSWHNVCLNRQIVDKMIIDNYWSNYPYSTVDTAHYQEVQPKQLLIGLTPFHRGWTEAFPTTYLFPFIRQQNSKLLVLCFILLFVSRYFGATEWKIFNSEEMW